MLKGENWLFKLFNNNIKTTYLKANCVNYLIALAMLILQLKGLSNESLVIIKVNH